MFVENKAGANGIIGTETIAKAPPDGYTLGLVASSHVGNPFSYKTIPFDTLNDLQPVTQTANVQLGLVVHPKLGVNNVQELVALLKANPGKIDYASTGPGGNPHLFAEVFMQLTGTTDDADSVQGQLGRASRPPVGTGAGDVRRGGGRDAAREGRQDQAPRRHRRQACDAPARRADARRSRASRATG